MISQETKERISKEAETFAESEATALAKMGLPRDQAQTACVGYYDGYIAGAEAEATRVEGLVEVVTKAINSRHFGRVTAEQTNELILALNNCNKPDK